MSAGNFFIFGCVSLSLLTFLCSCSVATSLPFVPNIGFVLYMLIFLPLLTFSMTLTGADQNFMDRYLNYDNDVPNVFTNIIIIILGFHQRMIHL